MLVFIVLLLNGIAYGQNTFPAGVANTYTLGEKEGYNGFNYAAIYHAPSGKVYTRTYYGEIAIHGNNYSIPLPSISLEGTQAGYFYEVNEKEIWYYDSKRIAVIRNDTVQRIIRLPEETFFYSEFNKSLIYVYNRKGYIDIYTFSGNELVKKSSYPALTAKFFNAIYRFGKNIYTAAVEGDSLLIYELTPETFHFKQVAVYATGKAIIVQFIDARNLIVQLTDTKTTTFCVIENGTLKKPLEGEKLNNIFPLNTDCYPYGLKKMGDKYKQIFSVTQPEENNPVFISQDNPNLVGTEKQYGSFYASTGNKPLRIFTTVKKYPYIFHNSSANSIFSLQQDYTGDIWAGSYNGGISIIHDNVASPVPSIKKRITNGGSSFKKNMYLIDEGIGGGLFRVDKNGNNNKLTQDVFGFYTYISKNGNYFYLGTGGYNGLWQTTTAQIETGKPNWHKIDSSKGANLLNILTITEDTLGRIWCGHPKRGILIYYPEKDIVKTWLTDKNESPFGAFSSISDTKGTVWMGSGANGLWYYNDYNKEPSPLNCKRINHPLLANSKSITALTQYNNWLVISGYDKIMLLNLDSFYQKNKIILRYLNPQEAGFTSFTEQNTLLTSKKDSTVWFSTSDMLYQWNVKKWLGLPAYKVTATVFVQSGKNSTVLHNKKNNSFKPGFNSFDLHVRYLSPDNMPRYSSAALIKDGDSLQLPEPSLQNIYSIKNISSGRYQFLLEIYEADGSTTRYTYSITIKKYLWQQWWFWALLSGLVSAVILYLYNLKQKKRVAEEKAKTAAAELQSFKSEQEKKLANLQLVTLSSQFRPHFILNALNTIGAQMDDKPEAESVLSRLGESVNLIFNHAQQQKILHPFNSEWQLVQNIIHIHRQMYLKQLTTNLPDAAITDNYQNINVPLGILQIPIENALLHGLSNRENGPWNLSISISEKENYIVVSITDNGVGRKKSATLSNFTKHGTGTKNLNEIVAIINATNTEKINITYTDDIYNEADNKFGTSVQIEIPKQLNYGT
ncbi:sensor histidine kinase [Ferruginibacter sp.]|nr:histidine kinase [Ferruginibacter sp.]